MKKIYGLSLFSNVGVAEAYFEEMGVDVCLANELDEKRAKFYQEVYPNTEMICGDITDDHIRAKIVNKAIKKKINFVISTPPCQGMSLAGNRDPHDVRNQLIFYAIDVIKRTSPMFVLMENVPQQLKTKVIVNGKSVCIPDYIKAELGELYRFNEETLIKAKDHGIPQLRERNVFLLARKDTGIVWRFPPKENKIVTLKDAIGELPSLDPELREGLALTHKIFPLFERKKAIGAKVSVLHRPPKHPWRHVEWVMHTPSGKSAIFNDKYFPQKDNGTRIIAHHNHYRRLSWDQPCRTITKFNNYISTLSCVHPGRKVHLNGKTQFSDPRALSIYELMIVMSLPFDWKIPAWATDSFIRTVIGEGIPSKLTKDIMLSLLKTLSAQE